MRGIIYFLFALVLFVSSCTPPSQVEQEATIPPTREILIDTVTSFSSEPLPTVITTSTPKKAHVPEPVLIAKFVFPYDYLTIKDLYFSDERNGWAVGRLIWYDSSVSSLACCKPKIFRTHDGGKSWTEIQTGIIAGILNSITFTDPTTGYIVGQEYFYDASAIIVKTIDGGKNWRRIDNEQTSGALSDVVATGRNQIWSVGMNFEDSQSLILRSSDGLNWATQEHPTEIDAELTNILFSSDKVGYATGFIGHDSSDPYIVKTINGGENWIKLPAPYNVGRLFDIVFLDDVTGYIIGHYGDTGVIVTTNDGGKSWSMENLPPDLWPNWFSESDNRLIIFANCTEQTTCNNLVGLFDGKELFPFETLTFPEETFTVVGNAMSDGGITFVTNAKPATWDAKYETTFYRYKVP